MIASAPPVASVSITSVSWLRLLMTRSNTCSMYSDGTSSSRLMQKLKRPA